MKYASLLWVALFVFVSSSICVADEIPKLASEMATAISESGKKAIAVADFTDLEGNTTKLGRFLAEEFSVALAGSGQGFQVIDRLHLRSLIKEHELSESGVIDTTTAQKLGKIAGVEALIAGTLTPFGDTIRVTAKILDTETARIIGAMSGDLPKTGAFDKLVETEIRDAQVKHLPMAQDGSLESNGQEDGLLHIEENKDFKFSVVGCVQNGKELMVSVLVESKNEDKNFIVDENSRAFDNFGNEYFPTLIEFGSKSRKVNRGCCYDNVENLLITGIPTKSILTFSEVDEKASFLPLLEFGNKEKKIQIRNIPITK